MREFFYAAISLAGAAVLTALAVLTPDNQSLWKSVMWIGAAALLVCACGLVIDRFRRRKMPSASFSKGGQGGRGIGGAARGGDGGDGPVAGGGGGAGWEIKLPNGATIGVGGAGGGGGAPLGGRGGDGGGARGGKGGRRRCPRCRSKRDRIGLHRRSANLVSSLSLATRRGVAARISDPSVSPSPARKSLVQPPASRTRTRPAAASHELM